MAGAVESCVNPIGVEGFKRMRALATSESPDISRPFDSKRQGFVLSEGAGIIILERLQDAIERKAKIYGEIIGFGTGNDAHHLTAPRDDGFGSTLCMRKCLETSNLEVNQIGYINAHATSTPVGDKAEAFSIEKIKKNIPVSSIKGHIGHTLGAAGALETISTVLMIKEGIVVGTKNLEQTDISADLEFVDTKTSPTKAWNSGDRRIALMNSFGFGGAFVSIALGEHRN